MVYMNEQPLYIRGQFIYDSYEETWTHKNGHVIKASSVIRMTHSVFSAWLSTLRHVAPNYSDFESAPEQEDTAAVIKHLMQWAKTFT